MLAVAICAVVTVAATGEKDAEFDTVVAKHIFVVNDRGRNIVSISPNAHGYGVIWTKTAQGKDLVTLGSTTGGHGMVKTFGPNGKDLVWLGSTTGGEGTVRTFAPNGKPRVAVGTMVTVFNKTGEGIAQMKADEYGNGVVGVYNRKGKGRTLQPGP